MYKAYIVNIYLDLVPYSPNALLGLTIEEAIPLLFLPLAKSRSVNHNDDNNLPIPHARTLSRNGSQCNNGTG